MNEQARQALRELVARHGASIVEDSRRVEGLMRDHFGEYRREVSALTAALEERVPQDLLAAPQGTPRAPLLARLTSRLTDTRALAEDAARWAVNSWAHALGLVKDEELANDERQPAAPSSSILRDTMHAAAASLVVSAQGGDYATITQAIGHAAPGTRIILRPGVYEESVTLDKNIELVGDGPADQIVIKSDRASCLVMRADSARVAGLTLRGEASASDEGFFAVDIERGRLVLEDCDISSRTLSCVAVHGEEADPLIRRCRVHDGADSGLYFFDGARGTLEDCEVYANANVCVAVTAGARPTLTRTKIHDGANAGLAVWGEAEVALEGCEIYANRLTGVGVSASARLTARACRTYEGRNTGVFVQRRGDATLEDCDLEGHREAEVAVETEAQFTALRCRVLRSQGNGFFIRFGGQALIQECDVSGNGANGVAVEAVGSLAAVIDCRVNANAGAGLKLTEGAAARVTGSDLTGNGRGPFEVEDGAHLEGGGNKE